MTMDDLTAFITARLDEDEAIAKAAWPGPWDLETEIGGFGPVSCVLMPIPQHKGARTGLTSFTPLGTQDADTAAHIARYDPARVLREVTAKRAIAETGASLASSHDKYIRIVGESILTELAAVWSDHPDYKQEWAT